MKRLVLSFIYYALLFGPAQAAFQSEHYADNFFFLGKTSASTLVLHWAFNRDRIPSEDGTQLKADFIGKIYWKGRWKQLLPARCSLTVFEKTIFPKHPAFEFQWPGEATLGKFIYHFEDYFLDITYNPLKPWGFLPGPDGVNSELFTANATLLGKNNTVQGLLLYMRYRWKSEGDSAGRAGFPAEIFALLNSARGTTYLLHQEKNPDSTLRKTRTKILSHDGTVLEDSSALWLEPFKKKWRFELPVMEEVLELSKRASSRFPSGLRYQAVSGKAERGPYRDKIIGFVLQAPHPTQNTPDGLRESDGLEEELSGPNEYDEDFGDDFDEGFDEDF